MRKNIFKLICGVLFFSALAAQAVEPILNEEDNTVLYVPVACLKYTLLDLDGGESYLMLNYDYDTEHLSEDYNKIHRSYPNYKSSQLIPYVNGDFSVEIPAVNLIQAVKPMQGQYGPIFSASVSLNKNQTQKFKQAVKGKNALDVIRVNAPVRATYNSNVILEKVSLPGKICQSILSGDGTVKSLLKNLNGALAAVPTKYASTQKDLNDKVLAECFDISDASRVNSFKDLLNIEVKAKDISQITAKTIKSMEQQVVFDQDYLIENNPGVL